MKPYQMVAALLGFTAHLAGQSALDRLEGCTDPLAIATALKTLKNIDWDDFSKRLDSTPLGEPEDSNPSVARLARIWPTPLRGAECDSKTCTLVISEGRIINGVIECGEAFDFEIDRKLNRTTERLHTIIVHYSTQKREDIVAVAKLFSRAVGLAEGDLVTVGKEAIQNFDCETKTFGKESCGIQMQLHRLRFNRWNLYFVFGGSPISSADGKALDKN